MFSSLKQQAIDFLEQYKQKDPATYAAAEQAIGGILILDGFVGIPHPFGGKKRSGIFGAVTGIFVGILCIVIPLIANNASGINKMTAATTATVVSLVPESSQTTSNNTTTTSTICYVVGSYTVDGNTYTKQSTDASSTYCALNPGQQITINYNPSQPGAWIYKLDQAKLILDVFLWLGPIVIIISLISFFIRLFAIIFGWRLLKDGRKNAAILPQDTNFQTIIDEIKRNFTSQVFGYGNNNTSQQAVTPPTTEQEPPQTL